MKQLTVNFGRSLLSAIRRNLRKAERKEPALKRGAYHCTAGKFCGLWAGQAAETFTEHFKQNYGVECIAALHHNKRKTNYHIHLIFSERKLLDEPVEKIATRNMFYDENGKHVRTKKRYWIK